MEYNLADYFTSSRSADWFYSCHPIRACVAVQRLLRLHQKSDRLFHERDQLSLQRCEQLCERKTRVLTENLIRD